MPGTRSPETGRPPGRKPWLVTAVLCVLAFLLLAGLLGWLLIKDTASTRRPVTPPQMLALPPPPPPPPPPPEPPPEPETPPEETVPEPDTVEPVPAEEPQPTPDTADPVSMDTDAQAGTDNFGIRSGSGGGMSGTGPGGAGNASYGRYLGYVMQQAIARDDRLKKLAFRLQVDVWMSPDGRITRVELNRGSGNDQADAAVVEALRQLGQVDQRPPASLTFPARVLVQGRRPGA
ncbi:MAG: TonB family protein [Stenotrophomonas sp.]|uniref:TonB family protein n=1 Tax=Stenotrophomonas sp. TaxID=69392 RepID=UPI003D6D9E96